MSKALEGMRIVDLTHMLAGPYCTYLLHLMGAEVIKIELPRRGDAMRWGDPQRPQMAAGFVAVNAGKKSLAVDLKDPRGRDLVVDLVRSADVLVENFRPGVMESLGLGYERLAALRPQLVYCSVSGYGQEGPMRAWPAYDHVVQAASGMAMMQGEEGEAPVKVGFPVVDTATGMNAACAVLAALVRLHRGGGGQYIDVSMLDASASLMFPVLNNCLANGATPPRVGNRGFTGSPGCDTFRAASGAIAVGANTPEQFARLCEILGVPEVLADPALVEANHGGRGFARARDGAALRQRLESAFCAAPASEWELVLNQAGIPAACVRDLAGFTEGPLQDLPGAVIDLPPMPGHPHGARAIGAGFRTRFDPPGTQSPAPLLGEHSLQVLRAAGFAADRIAELLESGVVADPSAQPSMETAP